MPELLSKRLVVGGQEGDKDAFGRLAPLETASECDCHPRVHSVRTQIL